MKYFYLTLMLLITRALSAQNIFKARLIDEETKEALIGVSTQVVGKSIGSSSNEKGILEIKDIPDGKQTIVFSYIGYRSTKKSFVFPLQSTQIIEIELVPDQTSLDEVVV